MRANRAPGLAPPNNRKNPQYKRSDKNCGCACRGQRPAWRFTGDRKKNQREQQNSCDHHECVDGPDKTAIGERLREPLRIARWNFSRERIDIARKDRYRRIGPAGTSMTWTGAAETINPSSSSTSASDKAPGDPANCDGANGVRAIAVRANAAPADAVRGRADPPTAAPATAVPKKIEPSRSNAGRLSSSKFPKIHSLIWRACLGREFEETDAALSGTRCPRNLAARFHAQPRTAQFKAHAQLLLRTNRRYHLQPDPLMTYIANNTAVRLLHAGVVRVRSSCLD